jgi:hypothetical protein
MEVPDTAVPPCLALVVLVCFFKVETSEKGPRARRVLTVLERVGLNVGFQVKTMPRHVLTAGHCVESVQEKFLLGSRVLAQGEASVIYALGVEQFKKIDQAQWYDVSVLEEFGAQQVLSFKSEYPSSEQQLERRFGGFTMCMAMWMWHYCACLGP